MKDEVVTRVSAAMGNLKRKAWKLPRNMWCSKSPPSSKEVTEATDLGAMIHLLKDATDIDCSIMGAEFGGGNSDMESHIRSCVDAIGSNELRRLRVATPASAKEGTGNFASASLGGVDTLFSGEAARSTYEEWTVLSRGAKPAANPLAGVASILPLARLDAWLATKCVRQVVSAASALSAYDENNDGGDHETSPAARAALLTSLRKAGASTRWILMYLQSSYPDLSLASTSISVVLSKTLLHWSLRRSSQQVLQSAWNTTTLTLQES
jgi:hypothetical protein